MNCASCGAKFVHPVCPLPTYQCACRGNYCRLLGRDPTQDRLCQKCLDAIAAAKIKP